MDEPIIQHVDFNALPVDLWFGVLAYLMEDLSRVALVSTQWRQSVERLFSDVRNNASYHALSVCLKDILKRDLTQYHTTLFKDVSIPNITVGNQEFAITNFKHPAHKKRFNTKKFFKTSLYNHGSYLHDAKQLSVWLGGRTISERLSDGTFNYQDRKIIRAISQNIVSSLAAVLLGVQLADLWLNNQNLVETKNSELEMVTSPHLLELSGTYCIYIDEYLAQFCRDSFLLRLFEHALSFHKHPPIAIEQINQKLRLEAILASIPVAGIASFLKRIESNHALKGRFETIVDDAFKHNCTVVIHKSYPIVAQRMIRNVEQPGYVEAQLKLFAPEQVTTAKLVSFLSHVEVSAENAHKHMAFVDILLVQYEKLVDTNVLIAICSTVWEHMTFIEFNEYINSLLQRFPKAVNNEVINAIFCALPSPENDLSLQNYDAALRPYYEQCHNITYESTQTILDLIPKNVAPKVYIDFINKILAKSSPAQIVSIFRNLIFGENGFLAERDFKTSLVLSALSKRYPKVFLNFQSVTVSALDVPIMVGNDFTVEDYSDLTAWFSVVMRLDNQDLASQYVRDYLKKILKKNVSQEHSELYRSILFLILRHAKDDQKLINKGKLLFGLMIALPEYKDVSYVENIKRITKRLTIQSMPVWVEIALHHMPDDISGKDYTEVLNTLSIRSFIAKHEAEKSLDAFLPTDVILAFEKIPKSGVEFGTKQFVEDKLFKEKVKRRSQSRMLQFLEGSSFFMLCISILLIVIESVIASSCPLVDVNVLLNLAGIPIGFLMPVVFVDVALIAIGYVIWKKHYSKPSVSFLEYQLDFFIPERPLGLAFTILGFSFFVLMVSLSIGFFLGNEGCIQLLTPLFNGVGDFFSKAFSSYEKMISLSPEVSNILGAIFFSILPLAILEVGRRINLLSIFFSRETKTQHQEDGNYGWSELEEKKQQQLGSIFSDPGTQVSFDPACELVDGRSTELSVK